jgi:DNA-binding LacI/PurR family transcriptional regulator
LEKEVPLISQIGKNRPRRTRLDDLAKSCGVSIATVSRALAGEKGVSPDIRQKIIEAAKIAGYSTAGATVANRVVLAASGAAMLDYMRNQFTWHVLDGLKERAERLGFEIVTRQIVDAEAQQAVLAEVRNDPAVGGLLILTIDDETLLTAASAIGKPVVLINGDDPYMRMGSVTPCNRSAARLAAEHLIALGHQRIAFLVRPGRRTIERRQEGWRDALRHHGLPHDDSMVLSVDDWLPELGTAAIEAEIEKKGLWFTAVLAANDSLAYGAISGLKSLGVSVPDAVSVVGIDDLPQAAFLDPPLTTMHIPMREIGATAIDLLRDGMLGLAEPPRRIELACPMMLRGSAGQVRS